MSLFKVEKQSIPSNLLRDRYLVPPFSILDAKTGSWLEHRYQWENILQDREDNVRDKTSNGNTPYILTDYWREQFHVRSTRLISTFDPFLAEILVKWFSKPGMTVLDPFAGGIVRGAVSHILGRHYEGIDISPEQIAHNNRRWSIITNKYNTKGCPVYHLGDAETVLDKLDKNHFDLLLTCPPYYDLECYTENPADLSNLDSYEQFLQKYESIISKCYNALHENAFAVITVMEIRDKDGIMYGFVPDTIKAFQSAGFKYYNELILENRVVSLGVRCPKYFNKSRKVGRHHQNILVFYKGDLDKIESKFGGEVMC